VLLLLPLFEHDLRFRKSGVCLRDERFICFQNLKADSPLRTKAKCARESGTEKGTHIGRQKLRLLKVIV
jgi:hypothetical protein